jgi:hypothetical protein
MNSSRHANQERTAVWSVVALSVTLVFSACSTTPRETVNPASNRNWVKVRSNPPTWYPRGIPANCATSHRDGEWIYAEDLHNTRFFVPLDGLKSERRKSLLAEALAARHPAKVRRIHQEQVDHAIAGGVANVIAAPFLALGGAGL